LDSAAAGSCRCAGDIIKIGLAPHPATVVVNVLQQQQQQQQLQPVSCKLDLHSLNSTCDDDAPVLAADIEL
jgi:hypothetical protein